MKEKDIYKQTEKERQRVSEEDTKKERVRERQTGAETDKEA